MEVMLESLKRSVWEANMLLPRHGLVTLTWGNVSGADRNAGYMVIKPSGVEYDALKPEDMSVVELSTGQLAEGLKPSSDTPTHLELYKAFPEINGVAHTHSRYATVMAQAGISVPALGTTHADYFYGPVPVTRVLTAEEVNRDYERLTGEVITELFINTSCMDTPAALVKSHGPFTWGRSALDAAHNSIILEEVCFMAWHTLVLGHEQPIPQCLLDKHYRRKHGINAYYGQ